MCVLFLQGVAIPEIAEMFNTTGLHVARVLLSNDIDIKPKDKR
jgi:hypothetical protein